MTGEMETGIYELLQDVENPAVDRRSKYEWHKQPVLKEGTRFVVSFHKYADVGIAELKNKGYNAIVPMGGSGQITENDEKGLFQALIPHLELLRPNEYTVGMMLKVKGRNICARGDEVLAFLVDRGVVTLDQISAAIGDMQTWEDEHWAALKKKHDL